MKWHHRFIEMAELVSTWSKDPSTKVGCVLVDPVSRTVVAVGFNGIPRGVHDYGYRLDTRPEKYEWIEHAERNVVLDSARRGVRTQGLWAYMNFAPTPCSDCARAFIQAGIAKVIGPNRPFTGKGSGVDYHLAHSGQMLGEAGVETLTVVIEL
jgi:dCMP deaminase